ncbi:hypothetical protein ACTVM6_24110, partial [Serratia bockelmannii]|uniref:hypothetical protein n=1 Tax=Serratia bockelmannii TaxID=2703793 RepID=UPI003FA7D50A
MVQDIAEAELQSWFEEKSRQGLLHDYIVNPDVLSTKPKWQRKGIRENERTQMDRLDKARKVYEALGNVQYVAGNRSISTVDHTQMRPDLIMISPGAHYLLVELKTRKGAERQGVQELLAYSTAIKMQLPFINEFMFIIVASHWDTLLKFSVRSMIIDGKYVLPLVLKLGQDNEFQLYIYQALFDIETSEPYDPFFAMVPHTLATTVSRSNEVRGLLSTRKLVKKYFEGMAFKITDDCQRAKQSGLVMVWSDGVGLLSECISLTVLTVNQFWKYSEHLDSEMVLNRNISTTGIGRVKQNVAQTLREEIYSRPLPEGDKLDIELEEIFRSAEAWQTEADIYPQSSLSFDLLNRHSNPETEEYIIGGNGAIQSFEYGSDNNLAALLRRMQEHRLGQICILLTFGDMKDFLRENNIKVLRSTPNLATFQKVMENFQSYKLAARRWCAPTCC